MIDTIAILGLTALAGLGLAATTRAVVGFWAIPMVGRQPLVVVFAAFWALSAVGFLLAELAPKSSNGVVAVILFSSGGALVAFRGREIVRTRGRDPFQRIRPWLVALHVLFAIFVIALMVTHQI